MILQCFAAPAGKIHATALLTLLIKSLTFLPNPSEWNFRKIGAAFFFELNNSPAYSWSENCAGH